MNNSHDTFHNSYRDSDIGASLSMGAMGRCDNVPAVDESSSTEWVRVYRPPIPAQETHLQSNDAQSPPNSVLSSSSMIMMSRHLPRPLITSSLIASNNPDTFQAGSDLPSDTASHLWFLWHSWNIARATEKTLLEAGHQ